MANPSRWLSISLSELGLGIAGVWLFVLYLTFGSLVVLSLGAHQFQYSVRSYQIDDGRLLPLWAINRIHSNWLKAEYELEEIEFELFYVKDRLKERIVEKQFAFGDPSYNQAAYLQIVKEVNSLRERVRLLEEELANATRDLNDSIRFQGKLLNPSVGDYVNSMRFFRSLDQNPYFGVLVPDFTSLPPEVLTVILVLAMGALGGTIHLTQLYFDQRLGKGVSEKGAVRGISYYIFRPFLGAITAFSVYILAKAGVLVIASPSDASPETGLSPFFVSFLGIISGLLAEQALERIQTTGKNWFSGGEEDRSA